MGLRFSQNFRILEFSGSARIILAGLRRCPSLPEDAPLTGQGIFGIFGFSCPTATGLWNFPTGRDR